MSDEAKVTLDAAKAVALKLAKELEAAEARAVEAERIASDFLATVAGPAGRLSLKNPPPTAARVERDADLIVRACRTARAALDAVSRREA